MGKVRRRDENKEECRRCLARVFFSFFPLETRQTLPTSLRELQSSRFFRLDAFYKEPKNQLVKFHSRTLTLLFTT